MFHQIVGIPVETNCAPLIDDLFLYCYESQIMAKIKKGLSKHSSVGLFKNNCRYLEISYRTRLPQKETIIFPTIIFFSFLDDYVSLVFTFLMYLNNVSDFTDRP